MSLFHGEIVSYKMNWVTFICSLFFLKNHFPRVRFSFFLTNEPFVWTRLPRYGLLQDRLNLKLSPNKYINRFRMNLKLILNCTIDRIQSGFVGMERIWVLNRSKQSYRPKPRCAESKKLNPNSKNRGGSNQILKPLLSLIKTIMEERRWLKQCRKVRRKDDTTSWQVFGIFQSTLLQTSSIVHFYQKLCLPLLYFRFSMGSFSSYAFQKRMKNKEIFMLLGMYYLQL